jgi:hypothetical protein
LRPNIKLVAETGFVVWEGKDPASTGLSIQRRSTPITLDDKDDWPANCTHDTTAQDNVIDGFTTLMQGCGDAGSNDLIP